MLKQKLNSWIIASRPKTLPAAIVPVLVGTSIAFSEGKQNWIAAFVALACSLLIQIGTNVVNDLYDFLSGKDTHQRQGPQRAAASGLLTVREMKFGVVVIFTVTFLLGLYLVYLGGIFVLIIGVLSIAAGIAYTAGPFPLAYNGLGDLFVFIFFGFVGTVGTYYSQALVLSPIALWASIPVGALITNILVINNFRDRLEDSQNGKHTLAVKFGDRFSQWQYILLLLVSYFSIVIIYVRYDKSILVLIPLFTIPAAVKLIKMLYTYKGTELNKTLELTAKFSALFGFLFSIGLLV
ncbi:MAG: 1,4-dihydroxy-2-naphthoate polyprenyltransferase [Melioribacteraceae bacterium]|nr:1,4-dihydroxy-2-naphthoate polyprenyltransferase [Melioribacteraceae bacterium]